MKRALLKSAMLGFGLAAALTFNSYAQELAPLNSDAEPDRMDWSELDAKFGPLPKIEPGISVGAVAKALTNEYWRSLGEGYVNAAKAAGATGYLVKPFKLDVLEKTVDSVLAANGFVSLALA